MIKGGEVLEQAYNIDTIVFDKTGTLTTGSMKVVDIYNYEVSGISWNQCQRILYAIESKSEHPVVKTLTDFLKDSGEDKSLQIEAFTAVPGKGIKAVVEGRNVLVGNIDFMKQYDIDTKAASLHYQMALKKGNSSVFKQWMEL